MGIVEVLEESVSHCISRALVAMDTLKVKSCSGQSVLDMVHNPNYNLISTVFGSQELCLTCNCPSCYIIFKS